MTTKQMGYAGNLIIFPAVFVLFCAVSILGRIYSIQRSVPSFDVVLLVCAMLLLERTYAYASSVSQKSLLARDVIVTLINLYVTSAVAGVVLLPILRYLPYFFGRKLMFASPEQLGPLWLQVIAIVLAVSFYRYWMHRLQHAIPLLWRFHAYHHRMTDVQALNAAVSHPIDFAVRHSLIFFALSVVGFDPSAFVVAIPVVLMTATFSHCSADLRGGVLNYLFVTPEVHRWHHAADVPRGHKYSVNYGVEFTLWDMIFGTFHLPHKDGIVQRPERLGYPGSELADEGNSLRYLLAPLGLYGPLSRLTHLIKMPGESIRRGLQSLE